METAFGLVGIILWIVFVIVLAAAITWLVVKISPAKKPSADASKPDAA